MDLGELLRTARWSVYLSQAGLAARAGTSQQAVGRYETGRKEPTLRTLRRLVQACGLEMDLLVSPLAGPDDRATLDLLKRNPVHRLPADVRPWALAVARALGDERIPYVLGGTSAARMHGAALRVGLVEVWVDPAADPDHLSRTLNEMCDDVLGPNPDVYVTLDAAGMAGGVMLPRAPVLVVALPDLVEVDLRAPRVIGDGMMVRYAALPDVKLRWTTANYEGRLELGRVARLLGWGHESVRDSGRWTPTSGWS